MTVTSVYPTVVSNYGGDVVTLTGSNFPETDRMAVTLGGQDVISAHRVTSTVAIVLIPAQEVGVGALEVSGNGHDWVPTASSVAVAQPFRVTAVQPTALALGGGPARVTVLGANFSATAHFQCHMLSTAVPATFLSPTSLTCIIPTGPPLEKWLQAQPQESDPARLRSVSSRMRLTSRDQPGLEQELHMTLRDGPIVFSISPSAGSVKGTPPTRDPSTLTPKP